ncbi:MAG: flagellar motor switch protein FliG [Planctomycetota bacterium]|nr:flagellar motor switch protein FliG [Planctomycetota bacterium]
MDEPEVEILTAAITKVAAVPKAIRDEVLQDFIDQFRSGGGMADSPSARSFLRQALGSDKANDLLNNVQTDGKREHFDFLDKIDTAQVASALRLEQPQTIALILTQLKPARAAEILDALNLDLQSQIVEKIGTMGRVGPTAVRRVEATLQKKLTLNVKEKPKPTGGAKTVADILNHAKKDLERRVFENLGSTNAELVEEVKRQMLVFEDLAKLTDQAMQQILREVDMAMMSIALKGASEGMRSLVFKNLSSRAAERLKEEIELLGPKPKSEVKSAQEKIVAVARKLEEDGKISLGKGGGGDEFI